MPAQEKRVINNRNIATATLDIIAPAFNESNNVLIFMQAITPVLQQYACRSRVIFINDGSTDDTQEKLLALKKIYNNIVIIHFTRNFGKEIAITAGLEYSKATICIPIDVDLQHPVLSIHEMLEKWALGYDHVIAIRRLRNTDSFMRKLSTAVFYELFNSCSELKIPNNAGDFRLMTRPVVNRLLQHTERNRFMKGFYPLIF